MTEIISIANQKGGVGKTTTAINLAAALAGMGKETLLIDMDPQGNASSGLGFDKKTISPNLYDVIIENTPALEAIKPTNTEYLDIICANNDLVGAEVQLVGMLARESRLKQALAEVNNMYRFVVVDCPPSLGLLTINALNASDRIIIPLQCEYYALEGLANFVSAFEKIRVALNERLSIEGIVLTMFDSRVSLGYQIRQEIEKFFTGSFFKTTIPRNIRLAEAPSFGQSIFQYDPRSRGAEAYTALAAELLEKRGIRNIGAPLAEASFTSVAAHPAQ